MLKSNRAACAVLQQFEVHAATDVTGFGLAGHLAEMLQASGKSAVIDLSRVPVLEGTQHVLAEGITSTLHAANKRSVANLVAAPDAAAEILFDPQTAGGLLVAVPEDQVVTLLAALHSAGYLAAARIGTVVNAMPSTITVR
jgi:selenide, water dikinase